MAAAAGPPWSVHNHLGLTAVYPSFFTLTCSADPNTGNILNFNVGENVDLKVPRVSSSFFCLGDPVRWCSGGGAWGCGTCIINVFTLSVVFAVTFFSLLDPPQTFWSRLAGRFGTKFYWQDKGEDVAIVNAVAAIDNCMREPMSRLQCNELRGELE